MTIRPTEPPRGKDGVAIRLFREVLANGQPGSWFETVEPCHSRSIVTKKARIFADQHGIDWRVTLVRNGTGEGQLWLKACLLKDGHAPNR